MEKYIIYYGGFELPDKNAAAHRVITISKCLVSLGYKPVLLGMCRGETFDGVRTVESNTGFEMYEIASPSGTSQWLSWMKSTENVARLIDSHPGTAAVILYNMPCSAIKNTAVHVHKLGIRLIYDYPEWCAVTEGSRVKQLVKRADASLVKKSAAKYSDGLIVISSLMYNHYKNSDKPLVRITPLTDEDDPIWHQAPLEIGGKTNFCFAGTLDAEKDYLHHIVAAFSEMNRADTFLSVVGVTHDDFLAAYPDFRESAISERIKFYGRLSHSETVRIILGADIYIFIRPSDLRNNAGFPTKLTEAAACCVPVICTAVSDIADYVPNCLPGFIAPSTDISDIRAVMEKASDAVNNKTIEKRDTAGLFDYRNCVSDIAEFLSKLGL